MVKSKGTRLLESLDAYGYNWGTNECDGAAAGVSMGDIAGAMADNGLNNATTYGTTVQRGIRKKSKAKDVLRRLNDLSEADNGVSDDVEDDDTVVAKIEQNVTKGDVRRASQATKILSTAGKIDKNTAKQIQDKLSSLGK